MHIEELIAGLSSHDLEVLQSIDAEVERVYRALEDVAEPNELGTVNAMLLELHSHLARRIRMLGSP